MESKKVRLGSISLLFTVIIMCVVILSVLSYSTVRADYALSQRTAESVTEMYELQNEGQKWLAQFAKTVSEGGWDSAVSVPGAENDGDTVNVTLEKNGRTLKITVLRDDISPEGFRITSWKESVEWEEDTELNLFM